MSKATWKRIIVGILSVLAVLAGLVALAYAIWDIGDFWNPAVPFRFNVVGETFMFSTSLTGLGMGITVSATRRARSEQRGISGRVRPVLLGIGILLSGGCVFAAAHYTLGGAHLAR